MKQEDINRMNIKTWLEIASKERPKAKDQKELMKWLKDKRKQLSAYDFIEIDKFIAQIEEEA